MQEIAQQAADLNPTAMTDEKISQIMLAAPLVRQMIEAVEEESLRRLKAGHPIPGLKVGSAAPAYLQVAGGQDVQRQVPVLDGTLVEYQRFVVPGPVPADGAEIEDEATES